MKSKKPELGETLKLSISFVACCHRKFMSWADGGCVQLKQWMWSLT